MRFVLEYKNGYVMSFVDDFLSASTMICRSIDEAFYEIVEHFKSRIRMGNEDMMNSMKEIKNLAENKKLAIDFYGIDLTNADKMRGELTESFRSIADEYLMTKTKCSR